MSRDPSGQDLVIERRFAAPPDLVWAMWTRPEHLAVWYGPKGATIPVARMDVRVGGHRLLCLEMTTPDGPRRMWFTGEYVEVLEHRLLVYTDALADEHGTVMSAEQAGLPAGHPTVTEVRVVLEPDGSGTRMTLTHVGIPDGSPGATGWAVALDALAARLSDPVTPSPLG